MKTNSALNSLFNLVKGLVAILGLLLSITIATFSLVYVLSGFSKVEYLKMLDKIPKETFGWLIIPTIIIAFGVSAWCCYMALEIGFGKNKERKMAEKKIMFEAGCEYHRRSLMSEDKDNYTFEKFYEKNKNKL